jgi:hypothetical protein
MEREKNMGKLAEKALQLIAQSRRQEVSDNPHFLIDQSIREINKAWESGAIEWMKANRPNNWANILTLEGKVNEMTLRSDTEGLKRALSDYQSLILNMVREFKALKETKEQGLFNFVERPKSPWDG